MTNVYKKPEVIIASEAFEKRVSVMESTLKLFNPVNILSLETLRHPVRTAN